MTGAMLSHIKLGGIAMAYPDGTSDGGMMFAMAVLVWIASAALTIIHCRENALFKALGFSPKTTEASAA